MHSLADFLQITLWSFWISSAIKIRRMEISSKMYRYGSLKRLLKLWISPFILIMRLRNISLFSRSIWIYFDLFEFWQGMANSLHWIEFIINLIFRIVLDGWISSSLMNLTRSYFKFISTHLFSDFKCGWLLVRAEVALGTESSCIASLSPSYMGLLKNLSNSVYHLTK